MIFVMTQKAFGRVIYLIKGSKITSEAALFNESRPAQSLQQLYISCH